MIGLIDNKLFEFFKKISFLTKNKIIKKKILKESFKFLKLNYYKNLIDKNEINNLINKDIIISNEKINYNFVKKFIKINNLVDNNFCFFIFINGFYIDKLSNYNNFWEVKKIYNLKLNDLKNIKIITDNSKNISNILQNLINKKYIIKNLNYKKTNNIKILNFNFNKYNKEKIIISNSYLKLKLNKNSISNIIEYYINLDNKNNFYISNKDIILKKNSKLYYTCLYDDNYKNNYSFSNYNIKIPNNSILNNNLFILNKGNVYYNLNIKNKFKCFSNYFSYSNNNLNFINSKIIHSSNLSESYQTYKTISKINGISKFNSLINIKRNINFIKGNILINGLITNKNSKIIIDPKIIMNTDSLEFNHGITLGNIEYEKIFYLQTRCITKNLSIKMIYTSFSYDIISKINNNNLKSFLYNKILNKI